VVVLTCCGVGCERVRKEGRIIEEDFKFNKYDADIHESALRSFARVIAFPSSSLGDAFIICNPRIDWCFRLASRVAFAISLSLTSVFVLRKSDYYDEIT
jgi:hypothetical protein